MKILSFNCRGFASPGKKLAMRRLIASKVVDILFLQEAICPTSTITPLLETWLPGWSFHSLDTTGRLGGVALGINNQSIKLDRVWGGYGFMGVDIYSSTLESDYRIINVYGPCHDRANFQSKLLNSSILQQDNIILGGDLNFCIGFVESWGHQA